MAVAKTSEIPAAFAEIAEGTGIQNTVLFDLRLIEINILRMEMVNRAAQLFDRLNRIDTLPEQMGGIEIGADDIANRFA